MTDIADLAERDPALSVREKETTIRMAADEKSFHVMSEKRTIVSSLLQHPEFELSWARVVNGDETTRVSETNELREVDAIYAVAGRMPVGCLTVKSKPRSNNHQSSVVNSETIDADAFT